MQTRTRTVAAILGVLTVAGAACSPAEQSREATPSANAPAPSKPEVPVAITPVLANVVSAPVPALSTDGRTHLAYELALTNTLGQEVTLTSVTVRAGDQSLLTLSGDKLGYWTRVLGTPTPTTKLGAGQAAIVWLDVAVDGGKVPADLGHTIEVAIPKPSPPLFPAGMAEEVAPVAVQTRKAAVIAPPLDGPNWLNSNSCCDMTAHRNAMNPLSGGLWAAERFAIDYVQLQPDGMLTTGDVSKLESYPYFGAGIRAVADGPVVAVLDGLPEQVPAKSPTGLPLEQYGGNHVVQNIGDGNYAFYAHLKTRSVKVRVGDQLTAGEVIGALGNSGNTDAPHLHFQVMSTPDPLRSDGLPFLIDSFTLDNRLASQEALDPLLQGKPATMQPGFTAHDESSVGPLVLDVMSYETQ
jgi:Peptidase family M23